MKRDIPLKNYLILLSIIVGTILITLFISHKVNVYRSERLKTSVLSGEVEEVKLDELNMVLNEKNDVVLYLGYTNDEKVYESEKRILKYIKKHNLVDKFIYVNVNSYLKDNEYKNILNEIFKDNNVSKVPTLIYVKNKEIVETIDSNDKQLYTNDIDSLNQKYELES